MTHSVAGLDAVTGPDFTLATRESQNEVAKDQIEKTGEKDATVV